MSYGRGGRGQSAAERKWPKTEGHNGYKLWVETGSSGEPSNMTVVDPVANKAEPPADLILKRDADGHVYKIVIKVREETSEPFSLKPMLGPGFPSSMALRRGMGSAFVLFPAETALEMAEGISAAWQSDFDELGRDFARAIDKVHGRRVAKVAG